VHTNMYSFFVPNVFSTMSFSHLLYFAEQPICVLDFTGALLLGNLNP